MNIDYEKMLAEAKKASKNSYSPYSHFAVGASVLCSSGKLYSSCNVENTSFGMTVCAERNAIFKAVSEGEREICAVAIYSPSKESCYPCGACRQVMYEFQPQNTDIEIITERNSRPEVKNLSYYLPDGFKI